MRVNKKVIAFIIPVILILYYWKDIILNISTHLYDWRDVPFVAWVMQNNIWHIWNMDFDNLYNTNAMYPFSHTLSFTEHMFFPSLLAFFVSLFAKNIIVVINNMYLINHIAIYVCTYLLSGRFTKNRWIKVLLSFYMVFSPYMLSQMSHFQMVFFWPLLLSLYFLFHPKHKPLHTVLTGVFLGLQFLSSVYLGVMGMMIVLIWYVYQFIDTVLTHKSLHEYFKQVGIVFAVFLGISMYSIYGYIQMLEIYKPVIDQGQLVTYAAHPTDYALVLSPATSLLHKIFDFFSQANHHTWGETAAFPGIFPLVVILIGIFFYFKKNKNVAKQNGSKALLFWSLSLIVTGFIFSLGPRLNWNGVYLVTPLPYYLIYKFVPFMTAIRATARWYFVFHFGIYLLSLYLLNQIDEQMKKQANRTMNIFLILLFILLLVEQYPLPIQATSRQWMTKTVLTVQKECEKDPGPLLEYPLVYRLEKDNPISNLEYTTNILLTSTEYTCEYLSGFSGYEPKKYNEYKKFFENNEFNESSVAFLKKMQFKYVKINKQALFPLQNSSMSAVLQNGGFDKLTEDETSSLYKYNSLHDPVVNSFDKEKGH